MGNVQVLVEFRAMRVLDAVVGPQRLRPVMHHGGLEGVLGGVRGGEGLVLRRVPVLRQHHVLEAAREAVDERHHLVAARHRELAARAEIILHIDDEEDVGFLPHGFTSCLQWRRHSP